MLFNLDTVSPYMLLIADVKEERRKKLPANYHDLDLWGACTTNGAMCNQSPILTFSARVQTVHKESNPRYWELIHTFKRKPGTGWWLIPALMFAENRPCVRRKTLYKCFMRTEMDYLVVNDFLLKNRTA